MSKMLGIFSVSDLKRLVENHLEATGLSKAELEKRSGLPKDAIVKLIAEETEWGFTKYLAFMNYLCQSAPLLFSLKNGGTVETLTISKGERGSVPLPPRVEYSPDMVAMVVEDDSFAPRFFKKDVLFFKEGGTGGFDSPHSRYPHICKIKDAGLMCAFVKPGRKPGLYNLVRHDYGTLENVELEWCARIEGITPSHD